MRTHFYKRIIYHCSHLAVIYEHYSTVFAFDPPTQIFLYIIKNFACEDQRQKWHYIVHIPPQGVNSAILFVYRTGYAYGKALEDFHKVFLSRFSAG